MCLLAMVLLPLSAHAFDSLFRRVSPSADLASIFPDTEARAEVQQGVLIGRGLETWRRLPGGGLRIERSWRYTKARHPKRGTVHVLPEPWEAHGALEVTANLRLVRSDTKVSFKRSADQLWDDYKITEEHDKLFDWDRVSTRASDDGRRLHRVTYLGDKVVENDRYDYDPDAIPLELAGFFLSVAVQRGLDRFDYELLLPGGSQHGVRVEIHRTRDPRPFARKYRLPERYLAQGEELAIVDMRLASPIKRFLFPYHFYMAYAAAEPSRLQLAFGGNPKEPMLAFRVP